MHHELRVFDTENELARAGASYIYERSRAVPSGEDFSLALSGGRSPWLMLKELTTFDVEWDLTVVYQVDERVAAAGSEERNLTHLHAAFDETTARIDAMDVDSDDLDDASRRYAAGLPDRFDLVHLGLGPDGHCASLIPGDPVLDVRDQLVAVSQVYQGTRRMTLTYAALARANCVLWLVSGAEKREALAKLLDGDSSIPAGRVEADHSLVLTDRSAMTS